LDDADFILALRLDENKNKHLSSVKNDINRQKEWIVKYKENERKQQEYYIIMTKGGKKIGTERWHRLFGQFGGGNKVESHCCHAANLMTVPG
jgi:hypothetical protein